VKPLLMTAVCLGWAGVVVAGSTIEVRRATIAAGGGSSMSSAYSIVTTAGQPVAGTAVSGSYEIRAGFWWSQQGVLPVDDPLPQTPAAYLLGASRPNPVRPTTTIRYEVPRAGPVRLQVYSVDGRVIDVLADGAHLPGRYEIPWSGTSRSGRAVPAGVYLYVLETPGFRAARKMVVLR